MSLDHAILGVISLYPCSGYDVKRELEQGGAGYIWSISFGSIYPRLRSLMKEGFIDEIEVKTEGRMRRTYELTAKGWQELAAWLDRSSEYPLPLRDELLLKMGFWGTAKPEDRGTLVRHLKVRRLESEQLERRLAEWARNGTSAIDEYGALILDYARIRLEAELSWIDAAVRQLQGPPQPPLQDPTGLFTRTQERRRAALEGGTPGE